MAEAALRVTGLEPPLRPGEVLALLGEGAGALLLGVAGLAPTSHGAWLDGRDIATLPPHRRGLGVVLDPPGLFPALDVAQNIGWPLRLGRAAKAARVSEAMAALGLEALAGRAAGTLSPAEARQVALARALALHPPVLLLQEPFAGLPAAAAEALALLLRELAPAVLLASTEAAPALTAADRVAVLYQGEVLQQGTPQAVYARPADALVAALTGEANFLPGTVEQVFDDECRVALAAGAVVEAILATPLPAGARCQVMVRPERLAVAAVAPEEMGEGALAATLRDAVFQGGQVRLRLVLADGRELLARRPAGLRLPAPGEACAVAWDAGHGLAFPP